MGNCCKAKQRRNVVLLLVGLDNAGKTVTVKGLAGENIDNSVPTVGFSRIKLRYFDTNVMVYDLGGGQNIRGIWPTYFNDAHGIIFVIDSSDYNRLEEVKQVLIEVLSNEKISGKPILILANKQDSEFALDELDLAEKLDLERLVNEKKCPTLIESCSAQHKKKKIDSGIKNGYKWLLNTIIRDYNEINRRVVEDTSKQNRILQEKRKNYAKTKSSLFKSDTIELDADPFKPIEQVVLKNSDKCKKQQNSASSFLIRKKVRPKSAIDIVKRQLEKNQRRSSIFIIPSNKTAPLQVYTPKKCNFEVNSAPNSVLFTPKRNFSPKNAHNLNIISAPPKSNVSVNTSETMAKIDHKSGQKDVKTESKSNLNNNLPSTSYQNRVSEQILSENVFAKNISVKNSSFYGSRNDFIAEKPLENGGNFNKSVLNGNDTTNIFTILPNSTNVIVETHSEMFAVNNFKPFVNKNVPLNHIDKKKVQENLDLIVKDVL